MSDKTMLNLIGAIITLIVGLLIGRASVVCTPQVILREQEVINYQSVSAYCKTVGLTILTNKDYNDLVWRANERRAAIHF